MMAQFGTGKNPPWARAPVSAPGLQVSNLAQQQVGVAAPIFSQPGVATPTVYSLAATQPTIAQHQYTAQQVQQLASVQSAMQPTAAVLPQPGIAIPTTLATTQVATVSYPTPRAAQQANQPKQRVFTGNVTKLHEHFGFVDEDVFFQTSCVKGQQPKVGDRVLVEATYNANMPFKWNATRIQVLPNQVMPNMSNVVNQGVIGNNTGGGGGGGHGLMKPPSLGLPPPNLAPANLTQPPPLMGQPTQPTGGLLPPPGPRPGVQPARRPDVQSYRDRDRDRDRGRDRDRHERRERRSPRKRSRSPRRSRSPASRNRSPPRRRPARIVPRYMVQIPKLSLDLREANVITLRSRYTNLYIPSDFFNSSFTWLDAFPLHRSFSLGKQCNFHVMSKEVQGVDKNEAILEPSDADHLFSAKVMLLASPSLEELYHKSCALSEDPSDVRESFQHPARLLQFLVGMKGKSEPMAIGGPWSPLLDGANPESDPSVLIKTAIRTTRALTGIDLTSCTQWYRFAEIRYHRPEETHKGRVVPARVETVVLFLPDVWSCMPSRLEWESLQTAYKKQLTDKIAEESKDTQDEEEEGGESLCQEKKDPTHYSELDPKNMKVADLRKELECRTLSSKGLKSQLIARLTKALKSEQEKEEQEAENKAAEEEAAKAAADDDEKPEVDEKEEERKKKDEEERKRREERDRAARERRYNVPDNPAILVHPSPTAKSGKFDCSVMSLSVLLDYRPEDNKEHSFEVSLFAELFNEMLMRDFGFRIYKSLLAAPERREEDKKDKKDHKDRKDSKDKDSKDKDVRDTKEKEEKKEEKEKEKEDVEKKEKEKSDEPSPKRKRFSDDEKKDEEKDKEKEKDKKKDDRKKGEKDDKDSRRDEKKKDKEDREEEDMDADDADPDEDGERDHKSRDHKSSRERTKYYSVEKDLLFAFVYFDQTHTGYLLDKDVEEIIHTIGLHLSRAQVKKLVAKLVSRDTLNYRKITDKPLPIKEEKESEDDTCHLEDEEKKDSEENKEEIIKYEHALDEELLAKGNRALLPGHSENATSESSADELSPSKSTRSKDRDLKEQNSLVLYKGAMVDINSVMQRLEKSEKTRIAVESKLKDIQEEQDELKSSFSSSQQNSQKVALELQELKKKLREQKKATEIADSNSKKFHDTLEKTRSTLSTVMNDFTKVLGDEVPNKVEIKKEKHEINGEN